LREGLVDGVPCPDWMIGGAALFQPVKAIAMALTVDKVELAIVIHVVTEDGEAGIADVPVTVPLPLVVVGIDLLEPSVRGEYVGLAVAIDVCDADAVAILRAPSEMVDAGLVLAEVDPENAGPVVVGECDIGLAVAVDVGEGSALSVIAVGDLLGLPGRAGSGGLGTGVAIPP